MYKLLLVDDEPIILDGLCRVVDWHKMGFEVIGTSTNGRDALKFVQKSLPDVIMSDIKMPNMDGIEFIKSLRNIVHDQVEVIFMSGYDDFEYAQNATKYGAMDYILKPSDPANIKKTFKRVKDRLDKKTENRKYLEILNREVLRSRPVLLSKLVNDIVERHDMDNSSLLFDLHRFEKELKGNCFTICTFYCSHNTDNMNSTFEDYNSVRDRLIVLLEQLFETSRQGILLNPNNPDVSVMLIHQEKNKLEETVSRLIRYIFEETGIRVIAGVGSSCENLLLLKKSYSESIEAIYNSNIIDEKDILYYKGPCDSKRSFIYKSDQFKPLVEAVRIGNIEKFSLLLEEQIKSIFMPEITRAQKENILRLLNYDLYLTLAEMGCQITTLDRQFDRLLLCCHFDDKKQIFENIMSTVTEQLGHLEKQALRVNNLCEQIAEYIHKNFNKPITIKEISDKFFFSANYIGNLFKKIMGIGVKEYIISVRLDEADRLIKDNQYKLYQISEMVGYGNYEYFRKLYKKYRGKNPSV